VWNGKYIVADSHVKVTGLDGIVVAAGTAKRFLGRDVSGFKGRPEDGLFGFLYGPGSQELVYIGQICYSVQEAFGFGARLWKEGNGYGTDFGLWRSGEKLRCLSPVEISDLKVAFGFCGIQVS
jgi:hypothetical protein